MFISFLLWNQCRLHLTCPWLLDLSSFADIYGYFRSHRFVVVIFLLICWIFCLDFFFYFWLSLLLITSGIAPQKSIYCKSRFLNKRIFIIMIIRRDWKSFVNVIQVLHTTEKLVSWRPFGTCSLNALVSFKEGVFSYLFNRL